MAVWQVALQFWLSAGKELGDTMSKEEYVFVHNRLSKALAPMLTEMEMDEAANDDWVEDLGGDLTMNFERYALGLCGIADMWTDSVDELDYVVFLNKLYRRITCARDAPKTSDAWAAAKRPREKFMIDRAAGARPQPSAPLIRRLSRHLSSTILALPGGASSSDLPAPYGQASASASRKGLTTLPAASRPIKEGGGTGKLAPKASGNGLVTFRAFRPLHDIHDLLEDDRPARSRPVSRARAVSAPDVDDSEAVTQTVAASGPRRRRSTAPLQLMSLPTLLRRMSSNASSIKSGGGEPTLSSAAAPSPPACDAHSMQHDRSTLGIGAAAAAPLPPISSQCASGGSSDGAPSHVVSAQDDPVEPVTMAQVQMEGVESSADAPPDDTAEATAQASAEGQAEEAAPEGTEGEEGQEAAAPQPWAAPRATPVDEFSSFSKGSTSASADTHGSGRLPVATPRALLRRLGRTAQRGSPRYTPRSMIRRRVQAQRASPEQPSSPHPRGPTVRPPLRRGFSSGSSKGSTDHWLAPGLRRQASSALSGGGTGASGRLDLDKVGRCYELFLADAAQEAASFKRRSDDAARRGARRLRGPRQEGEVHSDDEYGAPEHRPDHLADVLCGGGVPTFMLPGELKNDLRVSQKRKSVLARLSALTQTT